MQIKKSAWAEMTLLKVLFFWLIVPIIVAVVVANNYNVTITDKKIVVNAGIFNKRNDSYAVAGITTMSISQSFWGRICNYGTVNISLAGDKRVSLEGIKGPELVKAYLDKKLLKTADSAHTLVN